MSDLRDVLLVVVVGIAIYYFAYPYLRRAGLIRESMTSGDKDDDVVNDEGSPDVDPTKANATQAPTSTSIAENLRGDSGSLGHDSAAFPATLLEDRRSRAPLEAEDLIPSDPNSAWSTINPEGQGSIAYKNFLEATSLFGIDTIGSSLKNANTQIRSEPPNPRITVSPWNQSTVTLDTSHRELEVGESS